MYMQTRAVAALLLVFAISGPTSAAVQGSKAFSNGARTTQPAAHVETPDAAVATKVDALREAAGGSLLVTWGARGRPRALYGKLGEFGDQPAAAARGFLAQRGDLFGIGQDLADLELADERDTAAGTRVTFRQTYKGLDVHGGLLHVVVDSRGQVIVAGGDYFPDIQLDSTSAGVTPSDARRAALAAAPGGAGIEPLAEDLMVRVDDSGSARLAYRILQPTKDEHGPAATFEVFIDAESGEVIGTPRDVNLYATGRVYQKGNAMAVTGNASLVDSSSIPSSAYMTVTLDGLTSSSGLVGQYADCYTITQSTYRAVPDSSGNYLFQRSTSPATGAAFDAVMVYYYVDFTQRYIRNTLGLTNLNNRSVRFNINGTAADNSWYTPNGSGTGDLTIGSGGVDDGEDAELVLHEYGHALQDNAAPGIWGTAGTAATVARTGAMGEGFGDYWACSIVSQHFQQAGTQFETAVMEWDASSYSSANPPTIRSITSAKHYPEAVTGEVHADGEIWSSTLWQVRTDLGAQLADKLILQSHYLLTSPNATFADGANAILTAADSLGLTLAQKDAVRNRFVQRGILSGTGGGCSSSTTSIAPGASASGTLAATDCFSTVRTTSYHDVFTFDAVTGTQYTITMTSSVFDTWLVLKSASGSVIAQDDDSGGGTNSRIVFTASTSGTHRIEATSYDAQATGSYSVSLASSGGGGGGGGQGLVANGGFESGATSWTQSPTSVVNNRTSAPAFAGTWKATFLGRGTTTTQYLYQAPGFPATGTSRTLRFYLRIVSQEDTSAAYDRLRVRITNASNSTLVTLATFSNVHQGTYANYALVTLTIPASYAVAGNRLRFYATEDEVYATTFYVDDVSIQ